MPRIGYLFEHPTVSGAEGSALDLLAHVDQAAFPAVAFAPPAGELAARLDELDIARRPWQAPRTEGEEMAAAGRFRAEGLDILHANTVQLGRLTGRLAARCGAAGAAHVRAFGSFSGRARRNLCGNEVLIAVSRALRDHLITEGMPPGKVRVVYNGVSRKPAAAGRPIRAELGLDGETELVVWLGQITVRKGPDVFLDAARRCVAASRAHFLILGDLFGTKEENRALKRALLAELDAGPLRGRLHFLGWRRDAVSVLEQATVLLHTARQEPLSRVLIEALSVETPVVATAVGGTPEVIGTCGVLVPSGDAAAAAAAVLDLLREPARRARLAAAGAERWRTRFQADRMAREVAGIWHELSAKTGAGRSEQAKGLV
jgi:glycosyltransferase involved in cell wall biosynthesis